MGQWGWSWLSINFTVCPLLLPNPPYKTKRINSFFYLGIISTKGYKKYYVPINTCVNDFFLKDSTFSVFGHGLDTENDYRKDNLENISSGLKLWYDALSLFNPPNS